MIERETPFVIQAKTDSRDWLVAADEPLAGLQLRSGGEMPGIVAMPSLLELVRKSRLYSLRIARSFRAQDDREHVTAWVEVTPDPESHGCVIGISNWQVRPLHEMQGNITLRQRREIVRQLAGLYARLGPAQELISVEGSALDVLAVTSRMREGIGHHWTDFVELEGGSHQQPLHWRLLDGAKLRINGSHRHWKAHLIPLAMSDPGSGGFELYFVADEPEDVSSQKIIEAPAQPVFSAAIGREIAPVLRQPIARIIANAETIRTQLAGPLATEYSDYAADISSAGEHLLALIDDLTDLEVVEDQQFSTAPDHVDLSDLARRAAGILGMRARERGIVIDAPKMGEVAPAIGEFRRVLQILLNILGNAIRYSPEGSTVWLRVQTEGRIARLVVADQGEGLNEVQQARVFEKFERLGRSGDGGTGLGLYISRRLARAMGGELSVESAPGQGARFTLDLPADTSAGS